jgi:hypothetical protein
MSLPADAIAWHEAIVANLAQQMMELRALRRAVRLQIVLRARSRPAGSARRSRRPLTASSFGRHIEAATT